MSSWLHYDGRVRAINHSSAVEEERRVQIVESQRRRLHTSLREFAAPMLDWKPETYRVRVDSLGDGEYRYAVWPVNSEISEEPDLILRNGERDYDGSGGNHDYTFVNGDHTYAVYVYVVGKGSEPGRLRVVRGDAVLLSEIVVEEVRAW